MRNYCIALLLFFTVLYSCKKHDTGNPINIDFTASSFELKAGDSITFKDISTGTVSNWSWEFEGGAPANSNLSGPVVTYKIPGVYNVTLKLRNADNEVILTKEKMITVGYNNVTARASIFKKIIMQNEAVHFKDSSDGLPTKWKWEFEQVANGKILVSEDQNPQMNFKDTGYYNLKLIASNPTYSDTLILPMAFYIVDPYILVADFTSDIKSVYEGQTVRFSDQSLGLATDWEWKLQSGSDIFKATDKNPAIKFDKAGLYAVTLTVKNGLTSHTKTIQNYLKVIPAGALVGYFPFDFSATDKGPLNMGTAERGKISFTNVQRSGNEAVVSTFDGSAGIVVTDNSSFNFGSGDFTVSVWVQTSSSLRMMLWQESGKNGSRDNQTWLRLNSSTTQYTAFNTEDENGGSFIGVAEAGNLANGKWNHLVAIRSGLQTKIYLNGSLLAERTSTTGIKNVSNAGNFKIGMQEGTGDFNNYFIGQLDDLIIYKRALTEAEVKMLYKL